MKQRDVGDDTPVTRSRPATVAVGVPLRRVLVLVSAIVLLDVLFYSAISPLLPSYVTRLGLTKSQAGG